MPRQSLLSQTAVKPPSSPALPANLIKEIGLDPKENRDWLLKPLTTKEAAEELNTSPNALATLRCRGEGPAYIKHRSKVTYRRFDLLAYQQAGRVQPCE